MENMHSIQMKATKILEGAVVARPGRPRRASRRSSGVSCTILPKFPLNLQRYHSPPTEKHMIFAFARTAKKTKNESSASVSNESHRCAEVASFSWNKTH